MYRAFALKAIEADADLDNAEELSNLAARTRIGLTPARGGNCVSLDGVEVTRAHSRTGRHCRGLAGERASGHPQVDGLDVRGWAQPGGL